MDEVVVRFPEGQRLRTPLAQFFSVGESHVKFGELFASGHLPATRAVFEAGRLRRQGAQLQELKSEGVEITIDTGAAELSSLARYQTSVRNAPWLDGPPTRTHAATMGKVGDALEKLHEERGTDSPRVRACDLNVQRASQRDGRG